jgi:hypothetical protein
MHLGGGIGIVKGHAVALVCRDSLVLERLC